VSTETLTIRIDSETKQKLDRLAEQTSRTKSFLAARAIGNYLERESWHMAEIEAGQKELAEEKGISGEQVRKVARGLGKKRK